MTFPARTRPLAPRIAHAVMVVALCALAACTNSVATARFYTLSPAVPVQPAVRSTPLFIELMPVRVPERLARPQIVVRAGAGSSQIRILEQDRWSSHFDYELHDALTGAITARLGTIDISRGGRPENAPSYRIGVELVQLDAALSEPLQARFSWRITAPPDARNAVCQATLNAPAGEGIDGLVTGLQAIVAKLAQQVADDVEALAADHPAPCTGMPS